jgi:excisionase family DNA binding protein
MEHGDTTPMHETRLVGVRQAAGRLGLSVWTLYAWARTGRLPSVRLGKRRLFVPQDLEKVIADGRVQGAPRAKDAGA